MARQLPPLNALRAFEAAARHLSFTRAAAELHVTQAAISHQVKLLEEHLGVKLFQRLTRRLLLTDDGKALAPVLGDALDEIARAAEAIRLRGSSLSLNLTLTATFSAMWLMPRLGRFWQRHPEIELKLQHSVRSASLADFRAGLVDLAIRWGVGPWPGLEAERLIWADLHPVCSPALADGSPPLNLPEDLRQHFLLYEVGYDGWGQWLAAAGLSKMIPRGGMVIDDTAVMLSAAAEGRGVALVPRPLVEEELASGRLVLPFGEIPGPRAAYHLVYLTGSRDNQAVAAFCDFAQAEAAAEER
jgi:LysR family glycine cleavage system transcriptional activator